MGPLAHWHTNGKVGKFNEPSFVRVHARATCAMLTLRFLASSSTLACSSERMGERGVSWEVMRNIT